MSILLSSWGFGIFGGLASMDGGEEQNPLSIILVDGRSWNMAFEGEKSLVEGVRVEDMGLLQELEGNDC